MRRRTEWTLAVERFRAPRTDRLLCKLGVVVVVMFGFGYALVPFYNQICRATGLRDIGDPDQVKNTQVDKTRTVRVELDANVRGLPGHSGRLSRWSACIRAK